MAKVKEYRIDQVDEVCNLGKALSSPVRLEILQLLYRDSMIIGEIDKKIKPSGFQYRVSSENTGAGRADPYGRTAGYTREYETLHS